MLDNPSGFGDRPKTMTAQEHVMEHMSDLEERLLHEGDSPYEDITGQDGPPVDSSFTSRKNTATRPSGKEQMDVEPEARRRMRGKTRSISPEQSTQTLMQHHKRQREIMMTREEESMNLFHQSSQLLKTKSQH